jgi:hypothetical protein
MSNACMTVNNELKTEGATGMIRVKEAETSNSDMIRLQISSKVKCTHTTSFLVKCPSNSTIEQLGAIVV